MRSLVLLAKYGTIQETAESCHLSPPAVHKHLKTVEKEFGVRIYAKRGGRLELTDAGRLLLQFVREILAQHEAATAAMHDWQGARRGVVRVGAGPSFTTLLLPQLLKRYRHRFPNVDIFVDTATGDHLLHRLRGGHLDLIFDLGSSALEEPGVEVLAQWESPGGFVSGRTNIPNPCDIQQLKRVPFILHQEGTRMERIVEAYFDQIGFRPRVMMRSDSAEAIKAMVRSGLGISVLFYWNIGWEPPKSPLAVLRTNAPPFVSEIALIKTRSHYTAPAVLQFITLAKKMSWKNLHLRASG